jgi:hypothetical protein
MGVRDILLLIHGAAWLIVVVITALKTGEVPAELWAVLGVGCGGIVAVFRTDDYVGKRRAPRVEPGEDPLEDQT